MECSCGNLRLVSPAFSGMMRAELAGVGHSAVRSRQASFAIPCWKAAGREVYAPHARGWSAARLCPRPHPQVRPARAGVVRRRPPDAGRHDRTPRTRGGGPETSRRRSRPPRYAPHARGWSGRCLPRRCQSAVRPARAGVVRTSSGPRRYRRRTPRTRGGGPIPSRVLPVRVMYAPHARGGPTVSVPSSKYAPHARGWSAAIRAHGAPRQVRPARAGVVRPCRRPSRSSAGTPRTRGGGPSPRLGSWRTRSYAPHARGWSASTAPRTCPSPVRPARSGVVRCTR